MIQPWRREAGKRKVARILTAWRGQSTVQVMQQRYGEDYSLDGRIGHSLFANQTPCSCPMCGNPRKWYRRRSYHERQADEAFAQQIADVGGGRVDAW